MVEELLEWGVGMSTCPFIHSSISPAELILLSITYAQKLVYSEGLTFHNTPWITAMVPEMP